MIAVDTNLLVYAHRAGCPEHAAARRAIEEAANDTEGWGIPSSCLFEFWSVSDTSFQHRRRIESGIRARVH